MDHIKKNKNILEVLKSANPKLRDAILKNTDEKTICVLVEIISNLLKGNIKIEPSQKRRLVKYKTQFRKLATCCNKNKIINKKKARKIIIQSGGALPFLIPLLAKLIAKAVLGGVVAAGAGVATKKLLGQ